MFLNEITDYPRLLTALAKERGLSAVAQATGIALERLESLQVEDVDLKPDEEWKLFGYCDTEALHGLLRASGAAPPVYNRRKEEHGPAHVDFGIKPLFPMKPPARDLVSRPTRIGGYEVDFPLGVPACYITRNSDWIRFFSERGFSVLTHETVRSRQWPAYSDPKWAVAEKLDPEAAFSPNEGRVVADMDAWPDHPREFSMVNSIGLPSQDPSFWQAEIEKDLGALQPGSVLIVSVRGTPERAETEDDLIEDFALTAALAKEAGAQIIEANYSCPNVKDGFEDIYTEPDLAARISAAIQQTIGKDFPFFIKIGYLPGPQLHELVQAHQGFIHGIVAINTIRRPVVDRSGNPFFEGRAEGGVSGSLIKPFAKEVLENLVRIKKETGFDFDILGVGGVTTADDVHDFLDIGVTAVQTCTGAYMNPYLAIEARLRRTTREDLAAVFGESAVAEAEGYVVKLNA